MERPDAGRRSIWIVVTCMARLAFLRRTAPAALAQPELCYCLVDYSCPEGSGDWFRATFKHEIEAGRAALVSVPGRRYFQKTVALNAGGREALARGAEYLCFLDGDTILKPGFGAWVVATVRPSRFIVAARRPDGTDVSGLQGLVVMPAPAYQRTGGYDEQMRGWGGEDVDMRLRLGGELKLRCERVPLRLLECIEHGDDLREKYVGLSKANSNKRNLELAFGRVSHWDAVKDLLPNLCRRAGRRSASPQHKQPFRTPLPVGSRKR
ncbi:MAG TPA: galactosyltransferase-related protein [Polyangiaceae bacterium]